MLSSTLPSSRLPSSTPGHRGLSFTLNPDIAATLIALALAALIRLNILPHINW